MIAQLFDFSTPLNRKGFWLGCALSFLVSVALLIAWMWQLGLRDRVTATLMILPLRLLTLWPGLALYVRRLRDSGHSPWTMLFLLVPFGIATCIVLITPGEIADAEQRGREGEYGAQDDVMYLEWAAFPFEAGLIAGIPGPLQFLFALVTGTRPSDARQGQGATGN